MKFFSDCSGECCVCANSGVPSCLAGHGDDYFRLASAQEIKNRLSENRYPDYRQYMIEVLVEEYNEAFKED